MTTASKRCVLAIGRAHGGTERVAGDGLDRAPGTDRAGRQRGDDPIDVGLRAALDDAPLQGPAATDEAVVVEEVEQVVDRELEDTLGSRGPDRGRDRDEEVVAEAAAVAMLVEELPEGRPARLRGVEDGPRVAIEAGDVEEHAPVSRPQERGRVGEEATPPAGAEGQVAGAARRSERHVARLRLDAELRQQADEARVGVFVVDDEAGVDRDRPVGRLDRHGLDVAAGRSARARRR